MDRVVIMEAKTVTVAVKKSVVKFHLTVTCKPMGKTCKDQELLL